jgi:hypothetical protein
VESVALVSAFDLPELVEAHMALLGLHPFSNRSDNVLKLPVFAEIQEPRAQAGGRVY